MGDLLFLLKKKKNFDSMHVSKTEMTRKNNSSRPCQASIEIFYRFSRLSRIFGVSR